MASPRGARALYRIQSLSSKQSYERNHAKLSTCAPSCRLALADTRTPSQRRHIMQSVRSQNTGPEMAVRSLLHKLGFRFRLHRKELPGTPDITFPSKRKVIFVHGCFWHGHCCKKGGLPKSRLDYWGAKITKNRERDADVVARLNQLGWTVLTVWQCELQDSDALARKLIDFLNNN